MARYATKDKVLEAATKCVSNGIYPSKDNVREKLGYGSPNTINKYLKELREELPDLFNKTTRKTRTIPSSHQKLIQELYDKIYYEINEGESTSRAAELEKELDEAMKENEMLAEEISNIKTALRFIVGLLMEKMPEEKINVQSGLKAAGIDIDLPTAK